MHPLRVVAGQAQDLGQDTPALLFRRVQPGRIDEVEGERFVPDLDESAEVEDGLAVQVTEIGEACAQPVGNPLDLVAVGSRLLDRRCHPRW